MATKKKTTEAALEEAYEALTPKMPPDGFDGFRRGIAQQEILDSWGYGFEPVGSKWRAYRIQSGERKYLTQAKGKELHAVVTEINVALKQEISKALRNRGKN